MCRTLIFTDVLESKREVRVFPFDDAHLAEGASADNPQKAEVI